MEINQKMKDLAKILDSSDMLGWTRKFPSSLRSSLTRDIGLDIENDWSGILCLGVGGSGAGGMLLSDISNQEGGLPFVSWKDYGLPSWWGPDWLILATSYSGNTEETLHGVNLAIQEGGTVIGISSGGKLQEILEEQENSVWIDVPSGQPPRSAIGHIFGTQLNICWSMGLLPKASEEEIESMLKRLEKSSTMLDIVNGDGEIGKIAKQIHQKRIQIMSSPSLGTIGYRCRTQFNENSGILATSSILPELHHNEIVAWAEEEMRLGVHLIIFVWNGMDERIGIRTEWTLKTLEDVPTSILECQGESLVECMLHGAHLSDWLSIALALLRNKDPTSIGPIDNLKDHLSTIPLDQ
ncbi:MAG: hypothetical protein CMB31_03425 [Euryarchaeota archaeon]|nr:hypothetical protein [Euryarchaeota archaeon]